MGRDDWFRNTEWNARVAQTFEEKLRRARRKEQYLRIQACVLTASHPEVAHALLDRYFTFPDQVDAAQAHVDRAHAFLAQARIEDAVSAYERALTREAEFPNLLTQAYIDLPFEIATRGLSQHYDRALDLLHMHRGRLTFPVDHFKWNAAQALIAKATRRDTCYSFARAALEAADRRTSDFRYHSDLGLVPGSLVGVIGEMRALCAV
jgi:hypothetical protein